ncbi:MAG: c-type cytochrome [Geminicoccaceae bacterium]
MRALILLLGIGCLGSFVGPAFAAGNVDKGRDLAERFCKGCHVVSMENRHGGIGSTPSFFLMHDKLDNYRQRLWTLKKRPPHTAYERLDKVSNDDIEHLLAYISGLERPK